MVLVLFSLLVCLFGAFIFLENEWKWRKIKWTISTICERSDKPNKELLNVLFYELMRRKWKICDSIRFILGHSYIFWATKREKKVYGTFRAFCFVFLFWCESLDLIIYGFGFLWLPIFGLSVFFLYSVEAFQIWRFEGLFARNSHLKDLMKY